MNQRNNNIQYIVLGLAFAAMLLGLYWKGADLYVHNYQLRSLAGSDDTVTIAADELARLQASASTAVELQEERDALRADLLGTTTVSVAEGESLQEASVIGRPPQSPYDTIVINLGINAGIEMGDPVWWPPGIHLGEVATVREKSALVELTSSNDVRHPAFAAGVPLMLEGRGGDGMQADIPASVEIPLGTVVLSEAHNMPVGVVVAADDLATTDQQRLYIVRHVANSVIENVYVQK